jgi:hypothetical protein
LPFKITINGLPSNKTQTLGENSLEEPDQKQPDGKPASPFIDRLSIVLKVPGPEAGHDMYNAFISTYEWPGFFAKAKPSQGFNKAVRIKLDSVVDAKKWPFYECAYQDKCVTGVRIDFVPVDLGPDGMLELHSALIGFMDNGWAYFVEHGHISRLDVAVDFTEAKMDEFHFLPKQAATTKQWSQKGKLQTYQHGNPKGHHTSIYDRKAKRIAQKKSWVGKDGIRMERRMRWLHLPLKDLPTLANPFSDMAMVERNMQPPLSEPKEYIWQLFLNAAEHMGLTAALALLPIEKRTAYRKHMKSHGLTWWDVDAIWEGWKPMLSDLKIAQANAWF